MEIKIAKREDIKEIASMWEKLDYYNKSVISQDKVFRDGMVGGRSRYENLLSEMFRDDNIIVIAKIDNTAVGFVTCSIVNQFGNGKKDAIIDVTFVDDSARGKGVGSGMYAFLEGIFIKKGVIGITTEVFDNNQMSLNFHNKLGYKVIATAVELYKKL